MLSAGHLRSKASTAGRPVTATQIDGRWPSLMSDEGLAVQRPDDVRDSPGKKKPEIVTIETRQQRTERRAHRDVPGDGTLPRWASDEEDAIVVLTYLTRLIAAVSSVEPCVDDEQLEVRVCLARQDSMVWPIEPRVYAG